MVPPNAIVAQSNQGVVLGEQTSQQRAVLLLDELLSEKKARF